MSDFKYSLKILMFAVLAVMMVGCQSKREQDVQSVRAEDEDVEVESFTVIDVLKQDDSKGGEVTERLVQLLNPGLIRGGDPSVFLVEIETGEVFKMLHFREVLGVRSTNEKFYRLKLYSNNYLYGVDPIYQATEEFEAVEKKLEMKEPKQALGQAEFYWLLNRASVSGDLIGVRMLLRAGADVDGVRDYQVCVKQGFGMEPSWPINLAASNGHFDVVVELLKHGAKVNNPEGDGGSYNALTFAVTNGHTEVVDLLLSQGADKDLKSSYGLPLEIAKKKGFRKIVELLEAEVIIKK